MNWPVNGKMICLKDVPTKCLLPEMMGPVLFISSDGKVYSPCDGELVTVSNQTCIRDKDSIMS